MFAHLPIVDFLHKDDGIDALVDVSLAHHIRKEGSGDAFEGEQCSAVKATACSTVQSVE